LPSNNQGPTVRTRPIRAKSGTWSEAVRNDNDVFGTKSVTWVIPRHGGTFKLEGSEITRSEGHPFASRKGLSNVGGPFYNKKTYIASEIPSLGYAYSYWVNGPGQAVNVFQTRDYSGPMLAFGPDNASGQFVFPPSAESSDIALNALGATAIARCKPDNSIASLGSSIGEIMTGGLPHLVGSQSWKERSLKAKNAGSEYLNVQFGWVPLVSDINNFVSAVRQFDTVMKQYERDAGRLVRRRYEFPIVKSEDEVIVNGAPAWVLGSGGNVAATSGTRTLRKRVTKQQWFSGAFTYHLPSGYDSRNALDRYRLYADKFVGLNASPETLWELAPWSWAVDWFSNAGDVISNVDSFAIDGQVLVYGYMMEHTITEYTYSMSGVRDSANKELNVSPVTLVTETKKRVGASPYGFGVSWDGLSPFQISILTALGITRS